MQQLSKNTPLQEQKNSGVLEIGFQGKELHEKILQFGEGNFLRAFVDMFIDELNEKELFGGSVVIVPPIPQTAASVDKINAQDGCYTVVLRGLENNIPVTRQRVVTSVSRAVNIYENFDQYMEIIKNPHLRFIISNTTEAGIVFLETDKPVEREIPVSFPAKITALLYERYKHVNGAADKGFIFIPCELIDNNGSQLKEFVLQHAHNWQLPQDFINWINDCNHFTNTLVDRIVTGYPKDEIEEFAETLGYHDELLVTGEIFHFFAIEANEAAAKEINETLPFQKAGLNVVLTNDATPYKLRKVRILNGAHTMSVLAAFIYGYTTVGRMIDDPLFEKFLRKGIYEEVIPALVDYEGIDEKDLLSFADSVFDRFANPYIKHRLIDISLNSVSKFRARVLPSILDYYKKTGKIPKALTFSLAALLVFYKGKEIRDGALIGQVGMDEYRISDSIEVLEFFQAAWQKNKIAHLAKAALSNTDLWGMDLTTLPGFRRKIEDYLHGIIVGGVQNTIEVILDI